MAQPRIPHNFYGFPRLQKLRERGALIRGGETDGRSTSEVFQNHLWLAQRG